MENDDVPGIHMCGYASYEALGVSGRASVKDFVGPFKFVAALSEVEGSSAREADLIRFCLLGNHLCDTYYPPL